MSVVSCQLWVASLRIYNSACLEKGVAPYTVIPSGAEGKTAKRFSRGIPFGNVYTAFRPPFPRGSTPKASGGTLERRFANRRRQCRQLKQIPRRSVPAIHCGDKAYTILKLTTLTPQRIPPRASLGRNDSEGKRPLPSTRHYKSERSDHSLLIINC